MSWACKYRVIFTVAQTDKFLWFAPGCVRLPFWGETAVPWVGNRQIGHVLWTSGTILVEEDRCDGRSGGEAERGYRCEA